MLKMMSGSGDMIGNLYRVQGILDHIYCIQGVYYIYCIQGVYYIYIVLYSTFDRFASIFVWITRGPTGMFLACFCPLFYKVAMSNMGKAKVKMQGKLIAVAHTLRTY